MNLKEQINSNKDLRVFYHRHYISTYLTCAKTYSKAIDKTAPPVKRIRRSDTLTFTFKEPCIYYGIDCVVKKDKNNPDRWLPAYLMTEVEIREVDEKGNQIKMKNKILNQCKKRGDRWADMVALNIAGAPSDLHASDARYHKECLCRFFSNRPARNDS